MGSGLILLVIVGAWLAVLVPMGLRAHDGAATSRSGERWGDAMRVLRRRTEVAPLTDTYDDTDLHDTDLHDTDLHDTDLHDDDSYDSADDVPVDQRPGRLARLSAWRPAGGGRDLLHTPVALLRGTRAAVADHRATRTPPGPAARRRRVLFGLLAVAGVAAVAGRVGPVWLLDVAGAAAVLALLFLVHCRRQAVRRAAARDRQRWLDEAVRRRAAAEVEYVRVLPVRSAPVVRPEPVAEPAPAPRRVRPAAGAEWQPVPVPLPLYVGAPAARRDDARILEPDPWAPEADDEQGVFEPRRVVGGW